MVYIYTYDIISTSYCRIIKCGTHIWWTGETIEEGKNRIEVVADWYSEHVNFSQRQIYIIHKILYR